MFSFIPEAINLCTVEVLLSCKFKAYMSAIGTLGEPDSDVGNVHSVYRLMVLSYIVYHNLREMSIGYFDR